MQDIEKPVPQVSISVSLHHSVRLNVVQDMEDAEQLFADVSTVFYYPSYTANCTSRKTSLPLQFLM